HARDDERVGDGVDRRLDADEALDGGVAQPGAERGGRRADLRIAVDDLVDARARRADAHAVERHLLKRDVVGQPRRDEERVADVELRTGYGREEREQWLLPVSDDERKARLTVPGIHTRTVEREA